MAEPQVFASGHASRIKFRPAGEDVYSTIQVTRTTWDEEVEEHLLAHSFSDGLQVRIAGWLDGKGTVQAFVDLLSEPYADYNGIVAGNIGRIDYYLVGVELYERIFTIPVMIKVVNYQTEVFGGVQYGFEVALNAQIGTYRRPNQP